MSIKLIAVDMDGTFLSDEKTYNRPRFLAQYQRMRQQGIRFAVASGNQYYQLISFFPEIAGEIAFVAENGAWVVNGEEDMFNCAMPMAHFREIIDYLQAFPTVEIIVCGKTSAYILSNSSDSFRQMAARYYHRLTEVERLDAVDDTILKFGLNLPDAQLVQIKNSLHDMPGDSVIAVTTGHGNIDLMLPGVHKASGLRLLQQRWNIQDSEVLAFGDNGNDIEMLRQAGFGFVMANAAPAIKAVTPYQAPDNNSQGVLEIIDKALNGDAPFDKA